MQVRKTLVGSLVALAALVATSACSDDGDGDDEVPGELRIDGPAQVDPDFDPFATVPATSGG